MDGPVHITDDNIKEYQTIICVDASASMDTPELGGLTRWQKATEVALMIAKYTMQHDPDGLTLIVFGGEGVVWVSNQDDYAVAEGVLSAFTPHGSSNMAEALDAAFKKSEENNKKTVIFVITDGRPTSNSGVKSKIKDFTSMMEKKEDCRVLFVFIGDALSNRVYLDGFGESLFAKFNITVVVTYHSAKSFLANGLYNVAVGELLA